MIKGLSSIPSFGSTIVRNDYLLKGFSQAKVDTRNNNQFAANEFINAINYLKNDGKDDVYEVVKDTRPNRSNDYALIKNDEMVKSLGYQTIGRTVMELFTQYTRFDLKAPVDKPFTKSMKQKVNINDIKYHLNEVKDQLKLLERNVDGQVTEELDKKINSTSMYV